MSSIFIPTSGKLWENFLQCYDILKLTTFPILFPVSLDEPFPFPEYIYNTRERESSAFGNRESGIQEGKNSAAHIPSFEVEEKMAYMEKVLKELARMKLVRGEVMQIIVHHETECLVFEDQECNCDPRIEFIPQGRN